MFWFTVSGGTIKAPFSNQPLNVYPVRVGVGKDGIVKPGGPDIVGGVSEGSVPPAVANVTVSEGSGGVGVVGGGVTVGVGVAVGGGVGVCSGGGVGGGVGVSYVGGGVGGSSGGGVGGNSGGGVGCGLYISPDITILLSGITV